MIALSERIASAKAQTGGAASGRERLAIASIRTNMPERAESWTRRSTLVGIRILDSGTAALKAMAFGSMDAIGLLSKGAAEALYALLPGEPARENRTPRKLASEWHR